MGRCDAAGAQPSAPTRSYRWGRARRSGEGSASSRSTCPTGTTTCTVSACSVELVRHLRDQRRYSSVDELVAQMGRDVERARSVLGA